MKTNKKSLMNQRKILEKKIQPWLFLRQDSVPPSGWLKAIRGALSITTRQLAHRLGMMPSAVSQFEKAEARGKIALETIEKVARAMNCKLVYVIVPEDHHASLESILDEQAIQAARRLVSEVDQTMKLESQGLSSQQLDEQVKEIAARLKATLDSSLWDTKETMARSKRSK